MIHLSESQPERRWSIPTFRNSPSPWIMSSHPCRTSMINSMHTRSRKKRKTIDMLELLPSPPPSTPHIPHTCTQKPPSGFHCSSKRRAELAVMGAPSGFGRVRRAVRGALRSSPSLLCIACHPPYNCGYKLFDQMMPK